MSSPDSVDVGVPVKSRGSSVNVVLADEQARRAGLYALLAALLRAAPDTAVLDYLLTLGGEHDEDSGELPLALSMLALAARDSRPEDLRDEYHELFIGLGRGQIVPYGSWYQTGFLMEKPLSVLRDDLRALGFERADDVVEPEDHVAALFEVMAMLIQEGQPIELQGNFFAAHLAPWVARFCDDLGAASAAVLYRSVARLAAAFMRLESDYFSLGDQ